MRDWKWIKLIKLRHNWYGSYPLEYCMNTCIGYKQFSNDVCLSSHIIYLGLFCLRFVKVHRKLFFALFSKDVINLTKFCRRSVTNLVIGTVICFFKNLHLLYTNLSMVWMKCNEIRKPFLNNGLVLKKLKLHVSHLFWCVYS